MVCELHLSKAVKIFLSRIGASLVAQWLRIRLPMQETWVRALVREEPTCHGAPQLLSLLSRARAPQLLSLCSREPASHNYWSPHTYSLCSATREATTISPRTTTKSSPRAQQWRPKAAKNKLKKKNFFLSRIKKCRAISKHPAFVRNQSHTRFHKHQGKHRFLSPGTLWVPSSFIFLRACATVKGSVQEFRSRWIMDLQSSFNEALQFYRAMYFSLLTINCPWSLKCTTKNYFLSFQRRQIHSIKVTWNSLGQVFGAGQSARMTEP